MFKKKNAILNLAVLFLVFASSVSSIFAGSVTNQFKGEPYITINGDIPYFSEKDKKRTDNFIELSPLDELGRCGEVFMRAGKETLASGNRESLAKVNPSGWKMGKKSNNKEYNFIKGGWVYNRSHLLAYSLSGLQAEEKNLITGTHYLNITGMKPLEDDIREYIKDTGNHVLIRVKPYFEDTNLVCEGVYYEAYSVEDKGKGICKNVFMFNVEPGVVIDYLTGLNYAADEIDIQQQEQTNNNSEFKEKINEVKEKMKNVGTKKEIIRINPLEYMTLDNFKILIVVLIFVVTIKMGMSGNGGGSGSSGSSSSSSSKNDSGNKRKRKRDNVDDVF